MSGSESIMSIFVLSPALGTPLTLPTAAQPPPLLSTSNCEHPELETRSHLTENGGQCMNCLFFDLLCDHETSLMACFWTCEESRLWKKYIAKESKTLCSLLWLPWHLSWSKAMMFTSSGAHRLTPLLTMANPPISEYQSNVMLQFSFLPNIQFRFSPDSTTLPLSTNCSVKCVLAIFQHPTQPLDAGSPPGTMGPVYRIQERRGVANDPSVFTITVKAPTRAF